MEMSSDSSDLTNYYLWLFGPKIKLPFEHPQ